MSKQFGDGHVLCRWLITIFILVGGGLASCSGWGTPEEPAKETPSVVVTMTLLGERIANEEYRITEKDQRFHAVNRAQGLRAWFSTEGLLMHSRQEATWSWRYHFVGIGRGSTLTLLQAAGPQLGACDERAALGVRADCMRRLELDHGGVVEWYRNGWEGLEQGFDILERQPGEGALVLRGRVDGDLTGSLSDGGASVLFRHLEDQALEYGKLKASDAAGRTLPSHIVWNSVTGNLDLVIDDSAAFYPIQIDPLLGASWYAESDQGGAFFGLSVATAGDVDDDGYSDVIVGAPSFDGGEYNEGAAFVFLGDAAGLSTTAVWVGEGNQQDAGWVWI